MVYDKDRSGLMEIEELHHFIKVCHLVLSYRVYEKCADFTFAKKSDEMAIVMASARGVRNGNIDKGGRRILVVYIT